MDVHPIQRHLEASDIPPERLAGSSQLTEEQKIGEATRQFEAILLRQILENTQKPLIASKYADQSTAASIYRDLVTNQLADSISKSGSFGLGKTLEQQLQHPASRVSAGHGRPAPAQPTAPAATDVARPPFPATGRAAPVHGRELF